jgi:cytochrome c biogenesis protein CcmG/thiol:disulfide interchange protein DsbE
MPDAPRLDPPEPPEPAETRRGLIGPFSGRQLATALGTVVIVAAILAVVTVPIAALPAPGIAPQPTQFAIGPAVEGLRVGDRAPELLIVGTDGSPAPLLDLAGAPVRLADLRGHPVWISFWASWCPPCQAETPVLRETFAAYRARGLALVAVSVQESTVDDVRAYAAKYGLEYTVAADLAGDVFRRYRVYGLPTQVFLDANGIIRSIVQGPVDAETAAANLALVGLGPERPASPPAPATGQPTTGSP